MLRPACRGDLVLDQRIDGPCIRNAQQRLSEAHQGNALVGGQRILGEKALEHSRGRLATHAFDQPLRFLADRGALAFRKPRFAHQPRDDLPFVCEGIGAKAAAQRVEFGHATIPVLTKEWHASLICVGKM